MKVKGQQSLPVTPAKMHINIRSEVFKKAKAGTGRENGAESKAVTTSGH